MHRQRYLVYELFGVVLFINSETSSPLAYFCGFLTCLLGDTHSLLHGLKARGQTLFVVGTPPEPIAISPQPTFSWFSESRSRRHSSGWTSPLQSWGGVWSERPPGRDLHHSENSEYWSIRLEFLRALGISASSTLLGFQYLWEKKYPDFPQTLVKLLITSAVTSNLSGDH